MALLNAQLQWSFYVLLLLFFLLFFQILFFFSLKWTRYCSHATFYCWNLNLTITWKNVDNYSKKNVLVLVKDPVCNVQQFLLAFIERKMKVFLEKQEFNRHFTWDIWQIRKFMDHYRLCSLISEKIDAKCNFLKTFWDMECLPIWLVKVRLILNIHKYLSIESRIKYD